MLRLQFHSTDPNAAPKQELAAALTHFFLACRFHDPFGHDGRGSRCY